MGQRVYIYETRLLEFVELDQYDSLFGIELPSKGLADVRNKRNHDGQ